MRSLVVAFSCVFILTGSSELPFAAQRRPDQPKPSGLILGQVVDADSGKGVANVVVTIGAPTTANGIGELIDSAVTPTPTGATRRILTAADGRFLFRDLDQGRYMITAVAPSYVPGAYGQGRPDGPSESTVRGHRPIGAGPYSTRDASNSKADPSLSLVRTAHPARAVPPS